MAIFRYSGNKSRLVKFYKRPPKDTLRIVEPFIGSAAYGLSTDLPILGYDNNSDLVDMWKWLKSVSEKDLLDLKQVVVDRGKLGKFDVRDLKLDHGAVVYVRLNVASLMTGQLTSWIIYPQHSLPVDDTIKFLPKIKNLEIHCDEASYKHQDGDLLFIDPPYFGTIGGYFNKTNSKSLDNTQKENIKNTVMNILKSTDNPAIITYGDGAQETFTELNWELVKEKKVPNLRSGGTVKRCEWVSYYNWKE